MQSIEPSSLAMPDSLKASIRDSLLLKSLLLSSVAPLYPNISRIDSSPEFPPPFSDINSLIFLTIARSVSTITFCLCLSGSWVSTSFFKRLIIMRSFNRKNNSLECLQPWYYIAPEKGLRVGSQYRLPNYVKLVKASGRTIEAILQISLGRANAGVPVNRITLFFLASRGTRISVLLQPEFFRQWASSAITTAKLSQISLYFHARSYEMIRILAPSLKVAPPFVYRWISDFFMCPSYHLRTSFCQLQRRVEGQMMTIGHWYWNMQAMASDCTVFPTPISSASSSLPLLLMPN